MTWGTLGTESSLEGASGQKWTLRFERRLAPRPGEKSANPASSVWLVRDKSSSRLYAAKRQQLASLPEIDSLVDEAAAWRQACLSDAAATIPELVDVFVVRTAPFSVTFLSQFCARGLLPKQPPLSEPVLLTVAADLAAAAAALDAPHAHIEYESLLVNDDGRLQLSGFGAHRSAILRDNPSFSPADDAFDIGLVLYTLMFGTPPSESLEIPDDAPYSPRLLDIVSLAFDRPQPKALYDAALAAGAEPGAPVVDVSKKSELPALPKQKAQSTERNVDRLASGVDIASAFAALLNDLDAQPEAVPIAIFAALFKKPMSKDPLCAMRVLTMLHNLMLDAPDTMLVAVRKNDKFMDWIESSWTREAIEAVKDPEETHSSVYCFASGELAFYSALLRRKARFHMLAAGGFSGRWERTGAVHADGRDVLATRRRKVVSGMADVMEMASELGCRLADATDEEAPIKHAALGAFVSEVCLAFDGAMSLTHDVETVHEAQKMAPGIERLYHAARALVFAVEKVPSAGGEKWVEQFANEHPPDIVAEAQAKENNVVGSEGADFPNEGWGESEEILKEQRKKESKKKKKKKRVVEEQSTSEIKTDDITAADGALVVHGAGDAAAAAVTTMFGDLLAIDDGPRNHVAIPESAPRPPAELSNAQALASAFGVAGESVGGQYAALPAPGGYGDDEEDNGAYQEYQARQHEVQTRSAQGSSTAAWAARSRYGGGALVVSGAANTAKKSHPAFYQCGVSQQEEAQAAAQQAQSSAVEGYGDEERQPTDARPPPDDYYRSQDGTDDGTYAGNGNQGYYEHEGNDYVESGAGNENGAAAYAPRSSVPRPAAQSYYDDYDSYESVEYSREEPGPAALYEERQPEPIVSQAAPVFAPPPPQEYVFRLEPKFQLNLRKLRTGDKISEGSGAVVHKGEYNRETVALKKLTRTMMESSVIVEEFTNEVQVMCSLNHPNILKCLGASLQKPNIVFVTEFMKRGTLFDVLHKNRIKLTWAMIRKIALQIAQGMGHMHENGIIHRDLKSMNLFVDTSYNVKIGDFGLSRYENAPQGSGIAGTYQYMAPEVLRGEPHTPKSDVFAYAQLLCEIVSGTPPFAGMDAREVGERVVNDDIRPTIPPTCQRAYVNLIQMCWGTVPSTRPSFAEIVELICSTTK